MKEVLLKKVVVHCFINNKEKLAMAKEILESYFDRKFVEIRAKKTIPGFSLKKKSVVAIKATFNLDEGMSVLENINNKVVKLSSINEGYLTIGIKEYCDLKDFTFDIQKPLFGFDISAFFTSQGSRISERKRNRKKFNNLCTKEDIVKVLKEKGYEITGK